MRRYIGCGLALSLIVTIATAADVKQAPPKTAKAALDTWEIAYLGEARAGYVHTLVKTLEREGATVYSASTDLNLTVKRFDNVIQLQMITGSEEDADGKVLAVWMKQMLGKGQFLILKGELRADDQLGHQDEREGRRLRGRGSSWQEKEEASARRGGDGQDQGRRNDGEPARDDRMAR
jgi:hypothetical protein